MNRINSYTVGFILAIVLTLTAFSLTLAHSYALPAALPTHWLIPAILTLAMAQLVVQLVFFLHFGQGKESQWSAVLFCFTFFGILVVVLASVWIMYHLNYNMTPQQITQFINNQSSF